MSFLKCTVAALAAVGFAICWGGAAIADDGPEDVAEPARAVAGGQPSNWEKATLIGIDAAEVLYRLHKVDTANPQTSEDLENLDKAGDAMVDLHEAVKEYGPDVYRAIKRRLGRSPDSEESDLSDRAEQPDADQPEADNAPPAADESVGAAAASADDTAPDEPAASAETPSDEPAAVADQTGSDEPSTPAAEEPEFVGDHSSPD